MKQYHDDVYILVIFVCVCVGGGGGGGGMGLKRNGPSTIYPYCLVDLL